MSWREIIIDSPCKISISGNYLMFRGETLQRVHISEINLILISNTFVNITAVAIVELLKNKVKLVFCDEQHNPCGEVVSHYGCHNSSKKIMQQIAWNKDISSQVLSMIIHQKIINQANLLDKLDFKDRACKLKEFANEMGLNDLSNREGHAAKVYFNTLFGFDFSRGMNSDINSALNYGYSILLSVINREIVSNGCLTQLGINHCNEYNQFNLSSDLIEPFRIIVDEYVYANKNRNFDKEYKYEIVDLLNKEILLDRKTTLINGIKVSIKSAIDALNEQDCSLMRMYAFY